MPARATREARQTLRARGTKPPPQREARHNRQAARPEPSPRPARSREGRNLAGGRLRTAPAAAPPR